MNSITAEHKKYVFTGIILSICSIIPIWAVHYFPTVNGPAFLFITHMFKEMNNPAFCYSQYFMRHLHYMPYLAVYFLLFCFSKLFTLLVAQKIVLSLIVLLFPLSVFYFLKSIAPEKIIFGFPAYLIIYNFLFMRSYSDFVLAIALFFFFLGYWEKVKHNLNWKRILILNVFLLLIFLSHIIVVLFLLFILVIYQIFENKSFKEICEHLSKFVMPTLISIAYFVWFTFSNSVWQDNVIEMHHWIFKFENLYLRFLWPYSYTGKVIAIIPFVIVLFSFVYTKGNIIIRFIKNNEVSLHNTLENRNIIILAIIVMIYFCAPWKFVGWHKADIRLIPFIYIFFLACGQPFRKEKHRIAFVLFTSALGLILFIHIGKQVEYLDHAIKNEYLSGIGHIQKNKKMLPISAGKREFKVLNPYAHLFDYYGIYCGTITGKSLAAYNTISPVWYKDYKKFPNFSQFPSFNAYKLNKKKLRIIRGAYDYVLVWGYDKKIENMFLHNGFAMVFENKRLHILQPSKAYVSGITGISGVQSVTAGLMDKN